MIWDSVEVVFKTNSAERLAEKYSKVGIPGERAFAVCLRFCLYFLIVSCHDFTSITIRVIILF